MPVDEATVVALADLMPEGDWTEAFGDDAVNERRRRLAELAAPDLETAMVGPGGFTGTFAGAEGFVDAWRDWLEPFESYVVEREEEIRRTDDAIVFFGRQMATPKGSASPMENEGATVAFFDEGKLKRIEFHLDRASALRSAGLEDA